MSKIENFEKEYQFLNTADGTMFDVCHGYYNLFLKDETDTALAAQKFSVLLCWDRQTDKSQKLSAIHPQESYLEKINSIKDTTNTILGNLIKANLEVSEFYLSLWEAINGKAFFATDLDTVCAIIYLCNSSRIPYYKLDDGLKMENDDFSRIAKDNFEYLQKMIFILSAGYEQRTEIASLLLKVLDEVNDYNTKVVLFANLISFCERRAAQIQKKTGTTATSEE